MFANVALIYGKHPHKLSKKRVKLLHLCRIMKVERFIHIQRP